ncbi:elongation of very long chain fatty acids protein AAEL008004 [Rhipicephalus sanguineus]|uniref:Elongation of very long chain fatty acids protein n=1 Tax=Rhipicephalus sanguineus TaxID=34632 RepID=A0A9D4Q8J5_RHISA|nr:elongation of very long chain fatty acids protein AAEL008004 [Rhipicephalus sanguineus]KAH7969903.1 hypothetical protein HPB52_022614 [Rhipicephalus sanguineus]
MEQGIVMHTIHQLMTIRDPRTKDWKLLHNPSFIVVLLGVYLYMAKVWGPNFMKHRKPYDLKGIIRIYNLFQVVSNIYFLYRIIYYSFWAAGYSLFCQGLTYKADENSRNLLNAYYWYFLVRVADFLDTLFFVLTKKFSHISVLHVTHHTIVVFNGWMFLQFGPDGQAVFGVCLNAFVHIIMYIYYFLASLGPSIQKYLWWKRYLTRIQIVQFFIMIVHASIPIFVDCGYPVVLLCIGIPQVILILGLFLNFYVQSYLSRSSGGPPKMPAPQVHSQNGDSHHTNGGNVDAKKEL